MPIGHAEGGLISRLFREGNLSSSYIFCTPAKPKGVATAFPRRIGFDGAEELTLWRG
jgi:hypothetical protein